jgi:hypothetical protein
LVVLGVANITVAAIKGVGDTPGVGILRANQFWLMTFAAPVLGLVAAAIQTIPHSQGRKVPAAPASLAALASVGGLALSGLAVAGLSYRKNFDSPATGLSTVAFVGGLLAAGGLALAALLAFGVPRGALLSSDHVGENN